MVETRRPGKIHSRKRKRLLRKAILNNLYLLLLTVFMLTGTTFAWMTDTVTSGNNRILAGNLDLEVNHKEGFYNEETGQVEPFAGSEWASFDTLFSGEESKKWQPGQTKEIVLKLTNAGTVPLAYELYLHKSTELVGKTVNDTDYVISKELAFSMTAQAEPEPERDPESEPGPGVEGENREQELLWGTTIASPSEYTAYKDRKDLTAMRKRITEGGQNDQVEVVKLSEDDFAAATENRSKSISGELEAGKTAYVNIVLYLPPDISFEKKEGQDPYVKLGITVLARQATETGEVPADPEGVPTQMLMKAPSPTLMKASPSEYPENCMVQYVKREKITLTAREYEDLGASELLGEEEMGEIDLALVPDVVPGFASVAAGPDRAEVSVFKKDILFEESDDGEEYTGVPGFIIYRNTDAAKQMLADDPSLAGNEDTDGGTELYIQENGYTPLYAGAEHCWQGAVTMDETEQWPADAAVMCYSFGVTGMTEGTWSQKTLRLNIGKNRKIREICCEDEDGNTEDLTQNCLYDPDSGSLEFTAHGEGMNLLTILLEVSQEQ